MESVGERTGFLGTYLEHVPTLRIGCGIQPDEVKGLCDVLGRRLWHCWEGSKDIM